MNSRIITLPDRTTIRYSELINDLEEDNIVFGNKDGLYNSLDSYYTSKLHKAIIANRYKDITHIELYARRTLKDILSKDFIEDKLPDVTKSAPIINDVIKRGGKILLVTDGDLDGQTSAVIGYKFITEIYGYSNIEIIVNKREHGNGFNNTITDVILQYTDVDLLMTSDHGSSDKVNLTKIKNKLGCPVIVTDHHLFKEETVPKNMDVFINPQNYDNETKDITGTHVLYYVLLHSFYKSKNDVTEEELDKIYYYLTYVGMTTISDCMDLKVYINRLVVQKMMQYLNSKYTKHDTFWKYIVKNLNDSFIITETTIGYKLNPLLNSAGRVDDPRLSYELMISNDMVRTNELYTKIKEVNNIRKNLQSNAVKQDNLVYENGIVKVLLADNSEGVQGIIANNVMYGEDYKVVICFTQHTEVTNVDGNEVVTTTLIGSGRSQDENLHLKNLVEEINNDTNLIIKFGGHQKAIGIKMVDDIKSFYDVLTQKVDKASVVKKETVIIDDYIYTVKKLVTTLVSSMELRPYGIGFEQPLFCSDMYIESFRISRNNKQFLTLKLRMYKDSNFVMTAFYNVKKQEIESLDKFLKYNKFIRVVYNMSINSYLNYNKILLNITKIIYKKE